MPIAAGTRFERYEILRPLGKGGMGEVYLAEDTRLHRKVAFDSLHSDPRFIDLLRRFRLARAIS